MRQKVTIEKKVDIIEETSAGPCVRQEWQHVADVWAQDDQGNLTIRYHPDVRPNQKLTTATTVFIIGSVEEFYDGKIHLLRLRFSSARGTYARAPLEPKLSPLPRPASEGATIKILDPQENKHVGHNTTEK